MKLVLFSLRRPLQSGLARHLSFFESNMKKQLTLLAAAVALASGFALPAQAQNVAVVNGQAIPQSRLDALKAQIEQQAARMGQPVPPEVTEQLREEVIAREIFSQEARRQKLDETDAYRNKMELAKESILASELFSRYIEENPVTDAEAKAEYDELVQAQQQAASGKEYKSHHILVETEDEAKDIITQLEGGAKFEDLAREKSQDPGSGSRGGDLGWANPDNFVPEFSEALKGLEKGKTTTEPVQSQFGYHIIRLDDERDAKAPEAPPFNEVKEQIKEQMTQQKVAQYQQELREKAKVDVPELQQESSEKAKAK